MSQDWQQVINLAMAAAMIIFGAGAWSGQRKSGESSNAADIKKVDERVDEIETDLKAKIGWKDYNTRHMSERERVDLLLKPLAERIDRLERNVFNGNHRG